MKINLSSPWFALMCHWGRIASPNPFSPSQLTSCLQAVVCKVALEKYSGISAFVAQGWSSAWTPVCLFETFSSLGSNACITVCFYNLRGFVIWVRANHLFLCAPASSEKSVCLRGESCRLHFILESALPWWGLCKMFSFLLQEFREAVCEGRVVFGISVALGALREKKERNFYCDDFYLVILVTFREAQ